MFAVNSVGLNSMPPLHWRFFASRNCLFISPQLMLYLIGISQHSSACKAARHATARSINGTVFGANVLPQAAWCQRSLADAGHCIQFGGGAFVAWVLISNWSCGHQIILGCKFLSSLHAIVWLFDKSQLNQFGRFKFGGRKVKHPSPNPPNLLLRFKPCRTG